MQAITIAIDAMGGDYGPSVTVPAALRSLEHHKHLSLILVGDENTIKSVMKEHNCSDHDRVSVVHASQVVGMDESPATALRGKKDSSMRVAINAVKEGKAKACVSAGNTGALMVIARFVLKTLEGVDRPAILSRLPTTKGDQEFRMLDLGANVDSSPEHLFQFAVMGSVLSQAFDNKTSPTVALLNIGKEDIKGNEQVKETSQLLAQCDAINYVGYIESDAMFSGEVDVVVADGFVGNVALKTIEGAAKLFTTYAKESFEHNWITKIGGLLAKPAIRRLKNRIDPGRRNGASLIGLQGIVIKSHGGADADGFYYALEEAICEVEKNIPERIGAQVKLLLDEAHSV